MKMMVATLPVEEKRRLDALRQYGVLDTRPEEALDDLTTLAATICEVPIALISLVDEYRQWFKSKVGLEAVETPRETSFCAHALGQRGLFIVPDATLDERFARNPLVTGEPHIRFYAGAPLITPEGEALGTLCVIDRVPRALTPTQEQALRVLGGQVMTQFELRRRSRELQASERQLRAVIDTEPACVKLFGRDGAVQMMNPAGLRIVEAASFEEVAGRSIFPLIVPEDRAQFEALTEQVFRGESGALEYQIVGLRGTRRWLEMRAAPLRDENGTVTAVLGITLDIGERKQAGEKLRTSLKENADLCAALDQHAIVARTRADGQITFANDRFCAISKYAREELVGQNHRILSSGYHSKEFIREMWRTIRSGHVWHGDFKNRAKDGSHYWVAATIVPFLDGEGVPQQYVSIRTDITTRKEAEEALRFSEARFAAVFRSNPAAIGINTMVTGRIIDVNERLCEFSGWQRDEIIGKTIFELETWAELAQQEAFIEGLRTTGSICNMEVRLRHRSGEVRDVLLSVERVDLPGETEPVLVNMFTDITERKRANARFRRLVDSNAQGVIFWKTNGEITGANDAFLSRVGYTREDLEAGRINWVEITPPEYASLDRHCLEEVAARGACAPYEKEYLCKDGTRVSMLIGAASFEDNPEEGVCFVVDLTERKKLEQQFLRAQRMESIGTLAAGIAHDLNNSLGPIIMSLDLLKMRFKDADSQELLAIVSGSAQRGADMVRQVLSFGRGVEGRRMEIQIKHLVREVEKIVNDTFLKNIRVRTIIPYDLWTVTGDPTQLHQVLLNLCVNARDAMPHGGELTIAAENITLDAQYAGMNLDARVGPYVLLWVEDSGAGMSPEVMEKIFDPFFTTKEIGKGTGLGLSTTLAIVKSHGGFVRVSSEPGIGTKVAVYLPSRTEASPESIAALEAEMPRGHGELILVVDDEASVREITRLTLESFGYRVLLAADGAEAITVFASRGQEIAAMLTDMMMPVMDGPATIHVLRRMNPDLPIIAASGLAVSSQVALVASLGVKNFLPKPYTAETLLKAVRDVLVTR